MNSQQAEMIQQLESELRLRSKTAKIDWKESNSPESLGFVFGEVNGVTVRVSSDGLVNICAVRTYHPPQYPTPVVAAACGDELWARQKARDDANPRLAKTRKTGHLDPIVDPDLKCRNQSCACHSEPQNVRRRREQGGFNTNPQQCS